jgi:uncharacterized protein (DUF433 family)
MRIAMTKPALPDILALYERERSSARVAAALGLTHVTVLKYVRAAGGTVQRRGRPVGTLSRESRERAQRIVEMYRTGAAMSSVAVVFGITSERVRQIIVAAERATGTAKQRNRRARRIKTRICALHECHQEFVVLANNRQEYCGLPCARRSFSLQMKIPLPLAELAYARGAGATFAQLAAKYGVSIMTVFRRLRAAQE